MPVQTPPAAPIDETTAQADSAGPRAGRAGGPAGAAAHGLRLRRAPVEPPARRRGPRAGAFCRALPRGPRPRAGALGPAPVAEGGQRGAGRVRPARPGAADPRPMAGRLLSAPDRGGGRHAASSRRAPGPGPAGPPPGGVGDCRPSAGHAGSGPAPAGALRPPGSPRRARRHGGSQGCGLLPHPPAVPLRARARAAPGRVCRRARPGGAAGHRRHPGTRAERGAGQGPRGHHGRARV